MVSSNGVTGVLGEGESGSYLGRLIDELTVIRWHPCRHATPEEWRGQVSFSCLVDVKGFFVEVQS